MASYLDSLIFGIRDVFDKLGTKLPTRTALQFKGAVTVEDDPENKRTIVTVTGGGPATELDGEVTGPASATVVAKVGGAAVAFDDTETGYLAVEDGEIVAKSPPVPTAADVAFDPTGTGLDAEDVQAAIVELDARPPSSDATKIQGTDVSEDPLLEAQTYVKSAGGALVPRFVSPSSDRLVEAPGTVFAALGENLYVDVAIGDVDIKLPASPVIGATVRVKRLSANADLVVVDGNGSTIDGDSAVSIKPGEAALFRCYAAGKWARLGKCEAVGQGVVAHLGLEYDPIAFWKLDGTLNDYSGNSYHLSGLSRYAANYVTPTDGFGCMYVANTPSNTLERATTADGVLFNLPDVTVQALVLVGGYPASPSTYAAAVRAGLGGTTRYAYSLELNSDAGRLLWHDAAGSAIQVPFPTVTQGQWAHIAATRRIVGGRAHARVYIDGALVASASDLDPPAAWSSGSNYLTVAKAYYGLIGSVKVNDFALDDAQVYAEAQRAKRAP